MTGCSDPSRRRLLAAVGAAGTAVLAGCNVTDGDDEPTFSAAQLPDVDADPDPVTWPAYPVPVPDGHLRAARARTHDGIETPPTPLSPRDVPNGHVRGHLTDALVEARTHLDDALDAVTPRLALANLRRARWRSRYAAGGWTAIADGRTVDEALAAADPVESRAVDARDAHDHVGTDPVEAVTLHASVESLLENAASIDRDATHQDGLPVLQVADHAESVERARASLADATMLRERYADAQPDDAGSLFGRFERAAEALGSALDERLRALPTESDALTVADGDIEGTVAQNVLRALHLRATRQPSRGSTTTPAADVVAHVAQLGTVEAFRSVRDAVESGERYAVTESDDVRDRYVRAHDSLAEVPGETPAPTLARAALVDVVESVRRSDEWLAELDGELAAPDVENVVEEYVTAVALTEGVATATEAAVAALQR